MAKGSFGPTFDAVRELKTKYQFTGGGELQWFLGIQVLHNRKNRVIWLTQTDVINKLRKYSNSTYGLTRIVNTPIIFTDLVLYNKKVITYEIKEY